MHFSAAIPGGFTLGTYEGIARDLLTFVANFWPGAGALDRFCTSEARYTGKDPRDLQHRRHLEMKDPDRGDWVLQRRNFFPVSRRQKTT